MTGLFPFRSPLLGKSRLISLPLGTEMFQFPRFALFVRRVTIISDGRVSPFGHPGLIACVPLPLAYRSLPRPSSPSCAQASPTCFRSLDYMIRVAKQSTRVSVHSRRFLVSRDDSLSHDLHHFPLSNSAAQLPIRKDRAPGQSNLRDSCVEASDF